jgi:hypothetical protein
VSKNGSKKCNLAPAIASTHWGQVLGTIWNSSASLERDNQRRIGVEAEPA